VSVGIGSNIASLTAQRRLADGTAALSKSFERLSSGLRINRASDDAAGLAIADRLKADTHISRTAIRNTNDAISVINIIDSVLASQQTILARMSELAEQAANGVYTYQQRKSLDGEYQSLIREFDRAAESTEFNGQKLLRDSAKGEVSFQVGISGESASLLAVAKANSHSLSGVMGLRVDFDGDGRVTSSDIAIASVSGPPKSMVGEAQGRGLYITKTVEVLDSAGNKRELAFYFHHTHLSYGEKTGEYSPVSALKYGVIELNDNGSRKSIITAASGTSQFNHTYSLNFTDTGTTASVSLDFSEIDFQILDTLVTQYEYAAPTLGGHRIVSSPVVETAIGFTNIRWQTDAKLALTVLDNRRNSMSLLQSEYGAIRSRLAIAAGTLSVSSENFAAAESRIRDVDIAAESSQLIRSNMLQQTAAAVLAQANQQPALAIQLLRG
jgi:flagellin